MNPSRRPAARWPLMGAGLALVLFLQEADLLARFSLLPSWNPTLLVPLVLLIGGILLRRRVPRSPVFGVLAAGVIVSLFLSAVSFTFLWKSTRIHARWSAGSTARLASLASRMEREFGEFLADLTRPTSPASFGEALEDREEAFQVLQRRLEAIPQRHRERYGWTLWNGPVAQAWAGRTTLEGTTSDPVSPHRFRIIRRGAALVLAGMQPVRDSWLLESEYLLQSPLQGHPVLPLPALESSAVARRVVLEWAREGRGGEPADPEPPSSPELLEAPASRTIGLRDPAGRPLLWARILDEREEAVLRRLADRQLAAGILTSALACLAVYRILFRRACHPPTRGRTWLFLAAAVVLWGGRVVLLFLREAFPGSLGLGYDRFACDLAAPLFRSPLDLLLTSIWLGIQVWSWDRFLSAAPRTGGWKWWPRGINLLLLLSLGSFVAHFGLEAPRDARFDLLRVELFPPDAIRLMVQTGILLLFATWLALARTTLASFRRRAGPEMPRGPASGPEVALRYGFTALAALLYLALAALSSQRQRELFFVEQLLPSVEGQQLQRRQLLEEALTQIDRAAGAGSLPLKSAREIEDGDAYRIWASTLLNEFGVSSSLRIFSTDGRLLARFGLNLPPSPEGNFAPATETLRIRTLLWSLGGLRRRVLDGAVRVATADGEDLQIQVDLLDESENLPFVRAENLYVQLFRPSRVQQTNPELLGSEPLVSLYDWEGRPTFCNLEPGPNLPPRFLADQPEGAVRWSSLAIGPVRYRALVKRSGDRIYLLGFPIAPPLETAGNFVRLTLLGLTAWLGLSALLSSLAFPPFPRGRSGGRFFRRLLWLFLIASLVPLLALSFFLHRFAVREIEEDILSEGLASLASASRIVEDYLAGTEMGEDATLGDDVAYWLSRVVRQDINFYRGPRLIATSTRELYSSGFLSPRLDGRAYRDLFLRHSAFTLIPQRLADLDYLTMAAPISVGGRSDAILSIPLALKQREILRKRGDVDEAILIVTVVLVLLVSVLAHRLARRISDPITALAGAARRIESGDYDAEVRVPARDEPALLIDSFNRMAASLRRQREDLRRRRDYIEKILLNATTGVISTDAAGRLVTINPAARLLLGLSDREAEGKALLDVLEEIRPALPLREALRSSTPERESTWALDLPAGEKQRSLRVVSLPFREAPGTAAGRILLLEDLTETVRSSRLEAWAEMARRIAHEIKNPLTPIQLSADHLRRVHRSRDPHLDRILEECLDTIQKQVRTLRRIASDFSDYARIPVLHPERVPAGEFLDEALSPYRILPPGIRLESHLDPGTPDLLVDREATRRALVNLLQNALEAMPDGGRLTVSAAPYRNDRPPGRELVRLRVRDTGRGMEESTRARMFEPYFSTKDAGTGLGLAIVRRTAEEQGGSVEIHSEPGSGTEVVLDLPAAPRPDPGDPAAAL